MIVGQRGRGQLLTHFGATAARNSAPAAAHTNVRNSAPAAHTNACNTARTSAHTYAHTTTCNAACAAHYLYLYYSSSLY